MSTLTHVEARQLLHHGRPGLANKEAAALDAHLAACAECRAYAADLDVLAPALTRALHARWDHQAPARQPAQPAPTPERTRAAPARRTTARRQQARRGPLADWLPRLAFTAVIIVLGSLAVWVAGRTLGEPADDGGFAECRSTDAAATELTETPPASTAAPGATAPFDPGAAMDTYIETWVSTRQFMGAVLVAHRGEILLCKAYGMADQEQGLPNTPQTKFHISDITYTFTAMAILMLQEQGKLDVQASVCNYIPDCPAPWQPITLHHLLTKSGGLLDVDLGPDPDSVLAAPATLAEIVGRIPDQPLRWEAGANVAIDDDPSNDVLVYVIEQVSGQRYGDFLRQQIFDPLGMHDTGLYQNIDDEARDYVNGNGDMFSAVHPSWNTPSGLVSTVEDLYRWDQALYNETLVPQAVLDATFTPRIQLQADASRAYGYGWYYGLSGPFYGKNIFWQGRAAGVVIERHLDDQVTLIVLANGMQGGVGALYMSQFIYGAGRLSP